MEFKIENLDKLDVYKLMSNLIIPRPIAWISTKSKSAILNLAPFSYFTPLSSSPATVIVSIGHKKDGSPKDTLKNLRDTKRCSITIANVEDIKDLDSSAISLDEKVSEFDELNIDKKTILKDYPDVPINANVVFFGEYLQEVDLKDSKTIPVIIEIKAVYVNDKIFTNLEKLRVDFKSIARVGANYYKLGEQIEL